MPAGPIGAASATSTAASIGIEIVNPGHELGYRPFPEQQMEALMPLLAGIVAAPRDRRAPTSSAIPTSRRRASRIRANCSMGAAGAARPRRCRGRPEDLVDPHWTDGGFLLALERFGYDVRDALAAVVAFQRRFRPELIDGTIDGECRAILLALLLDRERGPAI